MSKLNYKWFVIRSTVFVLLFSFSFVPISGQKNMVLETSVLQSKIDKNVAAGDFKTANISVAVVDLESGELIGGHREEKLLSPASSLKLFTTFTALKILGESFKFKTEVLYSGEIDSEGTLDGNIIIQGGGDPTLGTSKFDTLLDLNGLTKDIVRKIKAAGIKTIAGEIITDESIFDSYPVAPTWQWNDLGNYYASGAWGLNINENLYHVYFSGRDIIGNRPKIHSTYPIIPLLDLSNEITIDSVGTGDNAYIFGGPYNYDKRIVGTIPKGDGLFTIKGSIPDPPTFFAGYLAKELRKQKIESQGHRAVYKKEKGKKQTLATYYSPELSHLVRKANFESNNLYTEAMLKMVGLKEKGLGSGQNGIAAINKILRKAGINPKDIILRDGSGLSARNNISALSMASFLSQLSKSIPVEELTQYLPRGGYSGTVRGMFTKSKARGNVWLKSGSMEGVQSYSGFMQAKSGKWVSFSVIVNGYTKKGSVIRAKLDKLIRDIYAAS